MADRSYTQRLNPQVTKQTVKTKKKATTTPSPKAKASKKKASATEIWTAGKRKTAVARIKLTTKGAGRFLINEKEAGAYFPSLVAQKKLLAPFEVVDGKIAKYDISIQVAGGGKSAQLDSCVHGLSKALLKLNAEFRGSLKKKGFLRRDPRMKERKKYGLRRARKAPQYSKR